MKKVLALLLVAICGLVLVAGNASAQDVQLEKSFASMDQKLIPPLFFTSANNPNASKKGMMLLNAEWKSFTETYYFYKPDYANWQSYMDQIDFAIQEANHIVDSGVNLIDAHEALEVVRIAMIDFRGKNGFPKFMTDKLTLYHEPMEHIALSVKYETPETLTDETIANIEATLPAAYKAWSVVEKCPVDGEIWGFDGAQMAQLYNAIANETQALNALSAALESGVKADIIAKGMGIKKGFVPVYTTFADFASVTQQ